MKRSNATHNILGTRLPTKKSKFIEDENKTDVFEPTVNIASTLTINSSEQSLNVIHNMTPETREIKRSHNMQKFSTTLKSEVSSSDSDHFYSISTINNSSASTSKTSHRDASLHAPKIREAKAMHNVIKAKEAIKSRQVMGTAEKSTEKVVITQKRIHSHTETDISAIEVLKPSQAVEKKMPKIREANASHSIEKETIEIIPEASNYSMGIDAINYLKSNTKMKPIHYKAIQVENNSNIIVEKAININVGVISKTEKHKHTKTPVTNEDIIKKIPKIRKLKASQCINDDLTAAHLKLTPTKGKVTLRKRQNKNKNLEISPMSSKLDSIEKSLPITYRESALNIVDMVYFSFQEREKGTQTEGLSQKKKPKAKKLLLENYTQTEKSKLNKLSKKSHDFRVQFSQKSRKNLQSASREHIATYLDNMEKTRLDIIKTVSKESCNEEENEKLSIEQDSLVFEQAESTPIIDFLQPKPESIPQDNIHTIISKDLAAGDQGSKEMENGKQMMEVDTTNKEPINYFISMKNYIASCLFKNDSTKEQEKATSQFNVKPLKFNQSDKALPIKNKSEAGIENNWVAFKNFINNIPFFRIEDFSDEFKSISEPPVTATTSEIVEDEDLRRTEANPWELFEQYITMPSVNENNVVESSSARNSPPRPRSADVSTLRSIKSRLGQSVAPSTVTLAAKIDNLKSGDMAARKSARSYLDSWLHRYVRPPKSTNDDPANRARPASGDQADDNPLSDDDNPATKKRPKRRRHLEPIPGIIFKPHEISGNAMRLGPFKDGYKTPTIDVDVQTGDDPENAGHTVLCTCNELIHEENKFIHEEKKFQNLTYTGMMRDGKRRIDYVLVVRNCMENDNVELIKLTFLTGLVTLGFQLEAEEGLLHKDLLFIKLHASDSLLHTYAEPLGMRKFFIDSHEKMINRPYWWNNIMLDKLFRFYEEREWIASVRDSYKMPLRLSNYDRSYITHILLHYKTFGDRRNYFGLERLIKHKIILDAFALHNGPFHRAEHTGNFNERQNLYSNWCGILNILWLQPLHLIYEYFGPKVGFYFTFYEFYNKVLIVASLWSMLLMWVYYLHDRESLFTRTMRDHTCRTRKDVRNIAVTKMLSDDAGKFYWFYLWSSLSCAECEGNEELNICPYILHNDICFDLQIMQYFENQYIIMYSTGIAFLGILFVNYWKRVELYWAYVLELGTPNSPGTHLIRPLYRPPPKHWWRNFFRRWRRIVSFYGLQFLSKLVTTLLPIPIILIPWVIIFIAYILGYAWTRPLSLSKIPDPPGLDLVIVPPKVDKIMEYSVLMVLTWVVHAHYFFFEKIWHWIALFVTKVVENHRTYEKYEESLIMCFFWISFNYTVPTIIYFAWLKGAFYYTPISYWDVALKVVPPSPFSMDVLLNMTALLPATWSRLMRRAVTLNCFPFSCFRQAVIAYFCLLSFRMFFIKLLTFISVRVEAFVISSITAYRARLRTLPTVEREYMLQSVSETHFTYGLNSLVTQMALVFLFAPIFPLAPLIALLVNMWDIRTKAHFLVVYSRRTIFHKTTGIGAWNEIIKLICYSVPIFHCITVARTEIIKIYLYHKVFGRAFVPQVWSFGDYMRKFNFTQAWWYIKFSMLSNYIVTMAYMHHPRFAEVNKDRVTDNDADPKAKPGKAMFYSDTDYARIYRCRVDGFLISTVSENYEISKTAFPWPYRWNYIEENGTRTAAEPHHYEWLFYKTAYCLVFLIAFTLVAVCVRRYVPPYTWEVERRVHRERQLRRLRLPRGRDRRPYLQRQKATELL